MVTFSERLKEAMQANRLKQTELSQMTGIDKSLISNYLKGTYRAKQNNLHLLSIALGVSEAWLMGYDVPKDRNAFGQDENESSNSQIDPRFSKQDSELVFALWGDSDDIDEKDLDDVKRFAAFIKERKQKK